MSAPLAAAALLSLWLAPPTADLLTLMIWVIVLGAGFAATGTVVAWNRPGPPDALFVAGGALLLAAPLAEAAGRTSVSRGLFAAATAVALPLGLLDVVRPERGARAMLAARLVLVACGAGTTLFGVAQHGPGLVTCVLGGVAAFVSAGWLQFELTTGRQHRQVLWLVLGSFASFLGTALIFFQGTTTAAVSLTLAAGACSLLLPLCAGIAVVAPDRFDVRPLLSLSVVMAVMLALVVAVFVGAVATWTARAGSAPPVGVLGLLAALIAAGFHPVLVQARASVDEMLFGGRPDPVQTLSQARWPAQRWERPAGLAGHPAHRAGGPGGGAAAGRRCGGLLRGSGPGPG